MYSLGFFSDSYSTQGENEYLSQTASLNVQAPLPIWRFWRVYGLFGTLNWEICLIHIQAKFISRLLLPANTWICAVHFCSMSKLGLATWSKTNTSGELISCRAYPEEGLKEWQFPCCFCCSHAVVQRICRTKRSQNQNEWTGLGMSIPSSQLSDSALPPSASHWVDVTSSHGLLFSFMLYIYLSSIKNLFLKMQQTIEPPAITKLCMKCSR